jgi:hypothetical protein
MQPTLDNLNILFIDLVLIDSLAILENLNRDSLRNVEILVLSENSMVSMESK